MSKEGENKIEKDATPNDKSVENDVKNTPKDSKDEDASKLKKETQDDAFVTEDDVFEASVKYYKDGRKLVTDIDEEFDNSKECKTFTCLIKEASQGDYAVIMNQANDLLGRIEDLDMRGIVQLEFVRFACLVREWNIDKEINNANILKLNPKLIKGICDKISDQIGMNGIV